MNADQLFRAIPNLSINEHPTCFHFHRCRRITAVADQRFGLAALAGTVRPGLGLAVSGWAALNYLEAFEFVRHWRRRPPVPHGL